MLTMLLLQVIAEFSEHGWQLPVLEYGSVIQVGRLAAQNDEIMSWIKTVFARVITPLVPSDRLVSDDDLDVIYVGLHGCGLEGKRAWQAVAVVVTGHRLVLVDFTWVADTIIETPIG
jgi:hypothetical protein